MSFTNIGIQKASHFVMILCWVFAPIQQEVERWNNERFQLKKKAKPSSTLEVDNNGDAVDDVDEVYSAPNSMATTKVNMPSRRGEKDKQKKPGDAVVLKTAVKEIIAIKKSWR